MCRTHASSPLHLSPPSSTQTRTAASMQKPHPRQPIPAKQTSTSLGTANPFSQGWHEISKQQPPNLSVATTQSRRSSHPQPAEEAVAGVAEEKHEPKRRPSQCHTKAFLLPHEGLRAPLPTRTANLPASSARRETCASRRCPPEPIPANINSSGGQQSCRRLVQEASATLAAACPRALQAHAAHTALHGKRLQTKHPKSRMTFGVR